MKKTLPGCIEDFREVIEKNKYYVINNTDMNITDISVLFETLDEGVPIFSLCTNEKIDKGETKEGELKAVDFGKEYAELAAKVTFEGKEEIYYFDGLFYDTFDGMVILEFYKTEDQLRLKAKADTGISQGDPEDILLDEEIYIDWSLEDSGYWDWIDDMD